MLERKSWLVLLTALLTLAGCATKPAATTDATWEARFPSRVRDGVTPFDQLKTRLKMEPGQTYLGFMMDEVKPALDKFVDEIDAVEKKYPRQYSKWQELLIEQGDGVAIRIDKKNYIFNIGYRDGAREEDVKSGRSYGVGPTGRESDPSDLAYLTELSDYLTKEKAHARDFYSALLLALVNNDSSGWAELSNAGQIVATDFLAIYTAESDRHLMVDLNPVKHPWEIDLVAATFVSLFVTETGQIMKEGALTEGHPKEWWAKGATGSGIGNTRRDRKKLQKLIAKHLEGSRPAQAALKKIESVVGDTAGDPIQAVFEFLNAPKGPKKMSAGDRKNLVEGMLDYMDALQEGAPNVR